MRVGVPAEVKDDEYRVALTPAGANELVRHGHEVWVERGGGEGSDFPDAAYERVGARIGDAAAAWGCELVLKVKEPSPPSSATSRTTRCSSPTCTSPRTPAWPTPCAGPARPRSRTRPSRTPPAGCRCWRR